MTQTKVPAFLKVAFECISEQQQLFIWHCGIIKRSERLFSTTKLLNQHFAEKSKVFLCFPILSDVNGTISCDFIELGYPSLARDKNLKNLIDQNDFSRNSFSYKQPLSEI